MSKLYYTNPYQKTFTAEVVSITEKSGDFHIVLDQTAFYPEGGGQPSDTGFIEDSPITYVYEENGTIYHVSPKKPIKIHKAKCRLDWARRLDHMQQHMAQHILSACLLDAFQANTVSFHLGREICTIDIDKMLTSEQLLEGERLANAIINENIQVEILYPTKQELKKLNIRKSLPKTYEPIRIVKIGDLDINPCCGTHPSSTIEVQLIKLIKWEKNKTNLRITFLAGGRGVADSLSKDQFVRHLCHMLKGNEQDVLTKVETLTQYTNTLISENRKLKEKIAEFEVKVLLEEAPVIRNCHIVKKSFSNRTLKEVQLLGSKLTATPNTIALLGLMLDEQAYLIFMCSKELKKFNMDTLLKDSITLIDGRGGGSYFSAQGGGKSLSNLESALDYAYLKISKS